MTTATNSLTTVMDPFFQAWGDKVIAWFEHQKAEYKAEHHAHYQKHYANNFGRMTKESMDEYRAIEDKWHYRLGGGWLQAVQYDTVEKVAKRVRRDMEYKKLAFVAKVEEKVGVITEVKLHIGDDLTPNGLVVGDKGTVRVETIGAGGWNIQCFHYRVLVKPVK